MELQLNFGIAFNVNVGFTVSPRTSMLSSTMYRLKGDTFSVFEGNDTDLIGISLV